TVYQHLITEYESQAPGAQVIAQYTPGKEDYGRKITTSFSGNTAPDVFLINYREYGQYAASGALEPLGPRLRESPVISESDFYELPLDAFRGADGELVCIPQNISSLVVYYNVELFAAAGLDLPTADWTLDDFVEAAQALTLDVDNDGISDVHGLVTDSSMVRYAPFIWMHGGEIVDNIEHPTRLLLDSPEARQGIEWFMDLGAGGHKVVPTEAETLAEDNLSRFMNGRAAMMLDSRRVVPTLREIDAFVWDVAALPRGEERASVLHSDAFCMSAEVADKEAAWRFIEYAVGLQGQEILAATGRTVPSLRSVAESTVFYGDPDRPGAVGETVNTASPASAHVFLDTIPTLRRLPSFATWPEVEDIFNAEFQKSLYDDFDIEKALENVNSNAHDAIRRATDDDSSKSVVDPLWAWHEGTPQRSVGPKERQSRSGY
ncbi:MAG TPA: sugar ABC transporter substrate-binding protein, partial [Thermomicrobiales bacterium]|nr:sugar ABC transporter substrate-binding protein [Thermomicrobiales bacterium]